MRCVLCVGVSGTLCVLVLCCVFLCVIPFPLKNPRSSGDFLWGFPFCCVFYGFCYWGGAEILQSKKDTSVHVNSVDYFAKLFRAGDMTKIL